MPWIELIVRSIAKLGYLGAFLVGFLGTTIPFFPSHFLIPIMGSQMNPFFVGIVSGLGSGLGQFLHYYIGVGGRHLVSSDINSRFEKLMDRFGKRILWLIFLVAATPVLPDEVIWIPLGLAHYPKTKAIVAGILGKMILCTAYALIGYYSLPFLLSHI
jgi:membrane protein YqaA with SNARE-associated domain